MDLIWLLHSNATGCVKKLIQDVHQKGLLPCKVEEATHLAIICDMFLEPHVYLKEMSGASYHWNDTFYEGTNKKIIQGFSRDVSECYYHNFGGYLSWLTYYLDRLCESRPHYKENISRTEDTYMAEDLITQKLRQDLLSIRRGQWGFRILSDQYSIYKTPEDQFYMSNNYDLNPMFFTVATLAVDRVTSKSKVVKLLNDIGLNSCACTARERRLYHAVLALCTKGIKKVSGTNVFVQQVKDISNSLLRRNTDLEVKGIGRDWIQEGIRHIILDKTRSLPIETNHTEQVIYHPEFDEVRYFNRVNKEKHRRLKNFLSWRIKQRVIPDRGLSTEGAKKLKETVSEAVEEFEHRDQYNWDDPSKFTTVPEKDYARREVVRNVVYGYLPVSIRTHKQYKKYEINECYRPFLAEKLGEIIELPGFIPLKAATMPYIYTHDKMSMLRTKLTGKGLFKSKEIRQELSIKASQDIEAEIQKFREENAEMLRIEDICVKSLNYVTEKKEHSSRGLLNYTKSPYPKRIIKFAITALKLATDGGNLDESLRYCYKRDIFMKPLEREKKLEAERRRLWLLKHPERTKKVNKKKGKRGDLSKLQSIPGLSYLSAVPLKKRKKKAVKPSEGHRFNFESQEDREVSKGHYSVMEREKDFFFKRLYKK